MSIQTIAEIIFGFVLFGVLGLGFYVTYLEHKGFKESIKIREERIAKENARKLRTQEEEEGLI